LRNDAWEIAIASSAKKKSGTIAAVSGARGNSGTIAAVSGARERIQGIRRIAVASTAKKESAKK
jgi:hypothetical protein